MKPIDKFIDSLKRGVYQNAERLFHDACILFSNNRFDSSIAIAVLSFEELGKLSIVDRSADHMILNQVDPNIVMKEYYASMANNHWLKQNRAAFESLPIDSEISIRIKNGWLDLLKMRSLYIDLKDDKIVNPNASQDQARDILHLVYESFPTFQEIAFTGFEGFESSKSEWLSSEAFTRVKKIYEDHVAS